MTSDKYLLLAIAYASRFKDLPAEDFFFKVEELAGEFKKFEAEAKRNKAEYIKELRGH